MKLAPTVIDKLPIRARFSTLITVVFMLILAADAAATSYGTVQAKFVQVKPSSSTDVMINDPTNPLRYRSSGGAGVYNYLVDTNHVNTTWGGLGLDVGLVALPGFCVELEQRVNGWASYDVLSADQAPHPGTLVPGTPPPGMGPTRANLLSEFWGRYGPDYNTWDTWAGSSSAAYAEAFQLGIWEIIYEDSSNAYDILNGRFTANPYRVDWWVSGKPKVNQWLSSLNGTGTMAELRALVHDSYQDLLIVVPREEHQGVIPEPLTSLGAFLGLGAVTGYLGKRRFLPARRGTKGQG